MISFSVSVAQAQTALDQGLWLMVRNAWTSKSLLVMKRQRALRLRFRGECHNGTCVSFCERRSIRKKPCICENSKSINVMAIEGLEGPHFLISVTQTCFRCCRDTNSSECVPYTPPSGRYLIVSNGTRCIHGYCYDGRCMKEAADFVQHLWRIIDKLDINSFCK